MKHLRRRAVTVITLAALVVWPAAAGAQYFGRNKVQYRTFAFEVLRTEHFDLYFYPEEADAVQMVARMAERWHDRLARFFGHELRGRQPIVLYAVPAHFRQTNAVEGLIGEGTGGVTEALKRRIVLPMSGSLADTNHVLGHEIVHAFQFDLTGADPRDSQVALPEILQFPLWFVEGMAEYLTLGPVDGQTAMWLRDAAVRHELPHLRDLDKWEYFPYRWGHAFWAFIGATYGDRAVASLIRSAANPRVDLAGLARQLGSDPDTLTADWHAAIEASTEAVVEAVDPITSMPRLAISTADGGRYNVGPSLSPDGRRLAFYSERDRFSVELFLADTESGHIDRKLIRTSTDPHFDSLEFLSSAGAWSPDGRTFVISATRRGHPVLVFIDPDSGDIRRELRLDTLDDALHPVFAPDGASIVLSGNRGGLIDLYRLDLASGDLEPLTEDPWADLEPTFTPDGRTVVFVTERFSTNLDTLEPGPLRLARLDLASGAVTALAGFRTGKHLSPQVSADGRQITFVAEPDGVSNLYRMSIDGGPIERLSSFVTGVAGITASSPALAQSITTGRLAFSVFENGGHAIYVLDPDQIVALVAPPATGEAALLPGREEPSGDVVRFLADSDRGLPEPTPHVETEPYRRGLSLDAIGQPQVTGTVDEFGTGVSGSLEAYFSDMLGDRAMVLAGAMGGDFADMAGQVLYVNRRHRWNWAAMASQVTYRAGELRGREDLDAGEIVLERIIHRQRSSELTGLMIYPFSTASRLEFVGGVRRVSFSLDTTASHYELDTSRLIDRQRVRESIGDPLSLAETRLAFVHDTSIEGATGPVVGSRARVELGQSAGTLQYSSLLLDARRYVMPIRPVTVALRGLHYGRYGRDAEYNRLPELFIGYPELIRGYGAGSFSPADCQDGGTGHECRTFDALHGSRLAVANVEVRAPLLGLMTGELEYGRIPVEVLGFFDAGVAWTKATRPALVGGARTLLRSAGMAVRANAFGLITVELSAARPLDRVNRGWEWQVGLRRGF